MLNYLISRASGPRPFRKSMFRGFVGNHERTGTHILITPTGTERGIGLHRLPADRRWDIEFLKNCKGLPWEVRLGRREQSMPAFGPEEQQRLAPIPPPLPSAEPTKRKFYVLRGDVQLEKYGDTLGCP